MSDTRRLTNPTLHICGRIEGSDTFGDNAASGSMGASAPLTWLNNLLGYMRCSRRRKEWRASQRTTSTQLANTNAMIFGRNQLELNFNWLSSNVTTDIFKVLLVFPRDDQQSEILASVARKLGWSVSQARNAEEAGELFRSHCHDLAIVDRRGTARSKDADEICRILSDNNSPRKCSIVALVKKSYFTAPNQEEVVILKLLNLGYNRALMECSHEGILMNELIGIYASESQPKSQLAAAQLLYLAVDRCRDIIHVTNDQHILQFANRASEKVLGYKSEELIGKGIKEFVTNENFALMDQQLQRGREFEGNVSWKRKDKGLFSINCRIMPMNVAACKTTYYVYLYDGTSFDTSTPSSSFQHYAPRGSVHSYGRRSYEIRPTNKPRRSTVTKLTDLPLEAPITKVITLLTCAKQDAMVPDVAAQIDAAIDILKNAELYAPSLREDDLLHISDPVTSDLLGALISINHNDPRKSSAGSLGRQSQVLRIVNSNQHQNNAKILKSPRGPKELQDLLESSFDWNFDIFKLETLSGGRPLYFLGMTLMNHYRVAERLDCDERTLQNWLTIIEANYYTHVFYHNSTHATDVLQAIGRFMRSDRLQMILDPLDEVTALLAAAAHDIGHPGKSSQFLCNSNNKLAILYNDITVLESHHSALAFKVTLSDDKVNVFKNLDPEVYKSMRQNIIDMILATEMTKHFEILAKFVNICSSRVGDESDIFAEDLPDTSLFLLPENVTFTKRMMIKCADVSNPTRPFSLYVEWTRRIAEEYFNQTDEEKRKKLPVMMPMFDRASCSIPKSQIGFVDYIINDMIEAWDAFIDMPEMIGNMRDNYEKWKTFSEQGITTLEDVKNLQEAPELRIYRKEDQKLK